MLLSYFKTNLTLFFTVRCLPYQVCKKFHFTRLIKQVCIIIPHNIQVQGIDHVRLSVCLPGTPTLSLLLSLHSDSSLPIQVQYSLNCKHQPIRSNLLIEPRFGALLSQATLSRIISANSQRQFVLIYSYNEPNMGHRYHRTTVFVIRKHLNKIYVLCPFLRVSNQNTSFNAAVV